MGIANFILPLVLFRIHVRSFLHAHTHTHIHLFLLLCCSYTPMLSSGSLFYLWLEFNSPFFFFLFFPTLPLLWSGRGLRSTIKAHTHFIFVSIKKRTDKSRAAFSRAVAEIDGEDLGVCFCFPRHGQIVWKWKTQLHLLNYLFWTQNKV